MGKNINSAPCYNCRDRIVGCHGICVDYIEYVKRRNKQKKEISKVKNNERIADERTFDAIHNMQNRYNSKKK